MNVVLFDDFAWQQLLPLTFTRPVADIRIGVLTIKEKWEKHLSVSTSYLTQPYLSNKYTITKNNQKDTIFINGKVLPNDVLVKRIAGLNSNEGLSFDNQVIAYNAGKVEDNYAFNYTNVISNCKVYQEPTVIINHVWDVFSKNGETLILDFDLLTKGRTSQPLSDTNILIGDKKNLFIEEGAVVEAAIINTKAGPVYIGKHAEVMEGSVIRGPFALCEHSVLKLAAKVYGPTTIGPHSKFGGEINNSVVFGYSNKAHDGFLGNSVIGEWCNLGADTNNSNLKNNYGAVKLYNYASKQQEDTGLQFCGLIMGDHSKCGINTMFNTGTVVGVGANIYGGDFPPTHIPSFSWGGASGFEAYRLDKFFETTNRVYARRNIELNAIDKEILKHIHSY